MSLKVKDDWKFVAMVMDRMFLWIFTLAVLGNVFLSYFHTKAMYKNVESIFVKQGFTLLKCPVGTAGIILQAPTLYDDRPAIDELLSEIEAAIYTKPQDFNGPPGLYDIV